MVNILTRKESSYLKVKNPYFDSKASFKRKADTIILYVFKTPTGKWSNKWSTLRFSSERPLGLSKMLKMITEHKNYLKLLHKSDIKKGYKLSEIILYSGSVGNKKAFD